MSEPVNGASERSEGIEAEHCGASERSERTNVASNALRDPMGRVGRSLGTGGLDTGSRGLGTGRGSTGARYRASVLGNGTKF